MFNKWAATANITKCTQMLTAGSTSLCNSCMIECSNKLQTPLCSPPLTHATRSVTAVTSLCNNAASKSGANYTPGLTHTMTAQGVECCTQRATNDVGYWIAMQLRGQAAPTAPCAAAAAAAAFGKVEYKGAKTVWVQSQPRRAVWVLHGAQRPRECVAQGHMPLCGW